jgi:broad-specificity NMP kinase
VTIKGSIAPLNTHKSLHISHILKALVTSNTLPLFNTRILPQHGAPEPQHHRNRHTGRGQDNTRRAIGAKHRAQARLCEPDCQGRGVPRGQGRGDWELDCGRGQGALQLCLLSFPKTSTVTSYPSARLTRTQLLDYLEATKISEEGGCIIDWHACDVFPERWVDLVIVLRCDSTVLYDRLTARGYKDKKLDENMDSEIMQVLLDEAREAYKEEIVVELRSDSADDVDGNLERIEQWIETWRKDRNAESEE